MHVYVLACEHVFMCGYVCVRASVRTYARTYVRACVYACARVCVCVLTHVGHIMQGTRSRAAHVSSSTPLNMNCVGETLLPPGEVDCAWLQQRLNLIAQMARCGYTKGNPTTFL